MSNSASAVKFNAAFMSGAVPGIPLEAPLPRASDGPGLPFPKYCRQEHRSDSFCCIMEHPVLLTDAERPDSPLGSGVIDRDIPIR